MDLIDSKYEQFVALVSEIEKYKDTIFSEQDTRLKVIDRVLIEILGWPYNEIITEPSIAEGFIDYRLSVNNTSRLIIEAKKDGKDFDIEDEYNGRTFKLNGPVLKSKNSQEGIKQAIYYCAYNSVELACLSNGKQWIIFRGSRLGDGKDILTGIAFVFTSLQSILTSFKLFYNLLAYNNVTTFKYRAYFQEEEGDILRTQKFIDYLVHPDSRSIIIREKYINDFDKIMNVFFKKLSGDEDPDMLIDCFIRTKESELADKKIGRIAEELVDRVIKVGTEDPGYLSDIIERVKTTERNEFVIIVGTKGAGKSTFIERFFKVVLSEQLKNNCVVIKINLGESDGDEKTIIEWLNNKIIDVAEKVVFNGNPSYDELQGMFYNEYDRWRKGAYKHLYETDKNSFKIEFGKHIEERRETRPLEYIRRIIGDIVKSRKKIPCLIFDNADHFSIDFQERVFQYARGIYEEEICLVIMPITDKTSWQLSKQGALQSFDNEALYLPTPTPKLVIQERIKYLERKVKEEQSSNAQYFIGKGIKLSIDDLTNFVSSLQNILLSNPLVSTWIGNLANLDIRRCLELTRDLISSPHLNLVNLLKLYIGNKGNNNYTIKDYLIVQALIKNKYNIYPVGNHKFIQNVYYLSNEFLTSPLLCIRILQLLVDKRSNKTGDNDYITVNQIINYFSAIGIDANITLAYLDLMLKTGLCYSYDPTIVEISNVNKLQLSPAGKQHYYWSLHDVQYIQCMLEITPIVIRHVHYDLSLLIHPSSSKDWDNRVIIFSNYLIEQDKKYCSVPEHDAYEGQSLIVKILVRLTQRLTRF